MLSLPTCPGLFYGSSAPDGMLARMRIPGGILTARQCDAIAHLADDSGAGYVQVTNRANVQIREIHPPIAPHTFRRLQTLELAAQTVSLDPIRNIVASPTAGIDPQMLIDTRPLVKALDDALQTHPEWAALSPKFSVCFDGGELVSVRDRRNDIALVAHRLPSSEVGFRVRLNVEAHSSGDVGIFVSENQCLAFIAALTQVYLDYTQDYYSGKGRKPRFRDLLASWGVENCLERVEHLLRFSLQREMNLRRSSSQPYHHLGIHSQRQTGLSYLGIALPLGRLESWQLRSLAALTQTFGSGSLRLTPWQTLLFPDVSDDRLGDLEGAIADLGLHTSATRFDSALVACSGRTGCASGLTDTQTHALALIRELTASLDQPLNIHFSGCEKSCAQQTPSDIALVGIEIKGATIEGYDVYVGTRDSSFGRRIRSVSALEVPALIEQMLQIYQRRRMLDESFKMFVDRHSTDQLQQWFNPKNNRCLVSHSIIS
ncbi:MAG: precorrin-3B synthase [Phormidesmis sp. CAN_BIN36]|nr:precorrin-3B synthase [Phormidesmis sp. CAN_BIN36]